MRKHKKRKDLEREMGGALKICVERLMLKHKNNKEKVMKTLGITRYTLNLILKGLSDDKD